MLELLLILIALCCAPYMLARMLGLPQPPSPQRIGRAIAPIIIPALELLGYLIKRALAYDWQPEPHERPRWLQENVSTVSVKQEPPPAADEQTDTQTDEASALIEAARRLQVDRTRKAIIDTLVLADWGVADIRGVVKGDNGTIGTEIAEARQRFGISPEPRPVTMRAYGEERVIDINSGKRIA